MFRLTKNYAPARLGILAIGLTLLAIVTGCGATPGSQLGSDGRAPAAATAKLGAAPCWAEDERTTGDEDMAKQYSGPPAMRIDVDKTYTAMLQTNKGDIEVELWPQDAPMTVNNFVCLAEDGYFDGTPFHRIVKGFVIQGGDPTGTGSGGPGYRFDDEPVVKDYDRGTLAMANAGPNTSGSQFFIVLDDLRGQLPKNYTIFGRVTDGLDVVDHISNTPTKMGRSGEKSTPTEPVILEKVTISES
jgi:cyclophilin family peptidyl-prolyl cis-trans isomerase